MTPAIMFRLQAWRSFFQRFTIHLTAAGFRRLQSFRNFLLPTTGYYIIEQNCNLTTSLGVIYPDVCRTK